MVRIGEGIALREQGERVAAHDLFAQVWRLSRFEVRVWR